VISRYELLKILTLREIQTKTKVLETAILKLGNFEKLNEIKTKKEKELLDKKNQDIKKKIHVPINNEGNNGNYSEYDAERFFELIDGLCSCLKESKWNTYFEWFKIGGIIKGTISKNNLISDDKAFEIFDKYSKKYGGENYHYENNLKIWENNIEPTYYSLGSLHFLAREDNPKLYEEIKKKDIINTIIKRKKEWRQSDIANLILPYIKNIYVCTDMDKKILYKFCQEEHRWKSDGVIEMLKIEIGEKMSGYVEEAIEIITKKNKEISEDIDKLEIKKEEKNGMKKTKKISTAIINKLYKSVGDNAPLANISVFILPKISS
jgi:hypothetical protein